MTHRHVLGAVNATECQLAIGGAGGGGGDIGNTDGLGLDRALSIKVVRDGRHGGRVRHGAAGQVNRADTENSVNIVEALSLGGHSD